jgi:hypothetical protein
MPDAGNAELLQFLRDRLGALDRQFVSVHDRFVAVDRRFDGLERDLREFRAEALGHFDAVYRSLERSPGLQTRLTDLERRPASS